MTWTAPRTWVASEVETAALFNAHLRDNMNALISGVQAYNESYWNNGIPGFSTVTWANGSTTAIAFDGVDHDPLGMWSAGAPTRLTIPVAGWYRFRGRVSGFASAGYTPKLFKSGSLAITGATATTLASSVGEYDVQCVAGDYLELKVVVAAGAGSFAFTPSSVQDSTVFADDFARIIVADLSLRWVSP